MGNIAILQMSFYLIGINIGTFALFGLDKYFAVNKMWRISEGTLVSAAIFGGSLGALVGQKYFRHKTKSFKGIFSVLIIIQIIGTTLYLVY